MALHSSMNPLHTRVRQLFPFIENDPNEHPSILETMTQPHYTKRMRVRAGDACAELWLYSENTGHKRSAHCGMYGLGGTFLH
jgi:hypothetical protein